MAAQRPPHRRWFVRRRRFQDAQGGQVTDIWLNVPLLPRRVRTWRSADRRVGDIHFDVPTAGCGMLLAGVLVAGIVHDVMTGQWVARMPEYLVPLAVLCVLTVLFWRARRRP